MTLLVGFVRLLRRLAVAGALGAVVIGFAIARDGFTAGDVVLLALLLAPVAIVLVFAQGLAEVGAIPDRVRRAPAEGGRQLGELSRIAAEARTARLRRAPFLLWRLRGSVGSLRDLAGVALPLKIFTPGFVGLAAIAAFACVALVGAGLVALIALAL
jgi:hypothetical protein